LLALIAALTLVGCEADPTLILPDPPPHLPPPATTSAFDPARSGTIAGRVTWAGPLPESPTFLYGVPDGTGNFVTRLLTGPNQPRIDTATRAVAGAVVFVQGIDPAACRPWDHPPVRVELADQTIRVRQGERGPDRVGFVRRGDAVEVVSHEAVYNVLRGRGAAFFSLSFPDPQRVRTRTFTEPGRVELSSGAGFYWASADLFVTDHPYWTTTDASGGFTLTAVPAGPAEIVVWHPGWLPARQDRDPETGLISRMTYAPPVERVGRAGVAAGRTTDIAVSLP
jgi:hypothetical protein